jgi:hypothetical protein
MDGDILPVYEGKLPGIVYSHRYFRKISAFRVSQGYFWKITAFPREECSRRPSPSLTHSGKAYKTKDLAILKMLALIIYCSKKWK